MKEIHRFSKEEKQKMLGEGPWCDEPDELFFEHEGIDCKILRIFAMELSGDHFGGYFCGYCKIPTDHPWYKKYYDEIEVDVHGGLTFNDELEGNYWIGFDCAHSDDLVPSMVETKKRIKEEMELKYPHFSKCTDNRLFVDSYKDIAFVLGETKSMAEQIKAKFS